LQPLFQEGENVRINLVDTLTKLGNLVVHKKNTEEKVIEI
jgi:hypothetical protein